MQLMMLWFGFLTLLTTFNSFICNVLTSKFTLKCTDVSPDVSPSIIWAPNDGKNFNFTALRKKSTAADLLN